MDVRMFDLFSYNGVIIIMPWENKIVFIFVKKMYRIQREGTKGYFERREKGKFNSYFWSIKSLFC